MPAHVTPTPARERGITLVEIMVVMVIIVILGAVGVSSISSSRASGGKLETKTAAARYADAVERYQTDHGRNLPVPGSASWPSDPAGMARGPVKVLLIDGSTTVRPYLKGEPPAVMTRPSTLATGAILTTGGPRAQGGTLVYRPNGFRFTIDAYWNGKLLCSAGDLPAGQKSC